MAVNHWVRGSSPCWGANQIKGLQEIVSPFLFTKNLISNHTSNLQSNKKPAEAGCIIIVMLFVILRKSVRVASVQPIAPYPVS